MSKATDLRLAAAGRMTPARMARLARKELQETLRDRRTVFTLVLMPLFVYPLLGLTFQRFLLTQATAISSQEATEYVLGFASEDEARHFEPLLSGSDLLRRLDANQTGDPESPPSSFSLVVPPEGTADVEQFVRQGLVDVGVRVRPGTRRGQTAVVLIFNSASPTAAEAGRELKERLTRVNDAWFLQTLRRAGVDEAPPLAITVEAVEPAGETAMTIATVLPFVLLLMTVTGAVYPAIDLTAGERERGTLEPLIAAPVSRSVLLAAKYVAVFTVAVITAGMNLIAMTATAFSLRLDRYLFGSGLDAAAISQVVALILVMAAFFSAMLLLVTSFARSFKEAQAYLIPLMLVSMAPGIASLMPELRLTLPLAVTPLLGIVLLARDLLTGEVDGLMVVACVVSTFAYAAIALWLAARAFGADAVSYGSDGSLSDFFQRPESRREVPPLRAAIGCLVALVPLFLLLPPLLGRWEGVGVTGQFVLSALLTFLLFFLAPTVTALLSRASLRTTFRLKSPGPLSMLGALLLGVSLWPFAYELEVLILSRERIEALRELFEPIRAQIDAVPLWLALITFALMPAICEEWCFRGLLLSTLRLRWRPATAVLVSALVFGLFHVVVRDTLFFERLLPTALLGVILGMVCVQTGSLWPGVLLHGVHNGLLLSLAAWQDELEAAGWTGGEGTHLPWTWLAVAAAIVAGGAWLVRAMSRRTLQADLTNPAPPRAGG